MASAYQSPGVYVQEVQSGSAPIAGVGTSTAGFIGVFSAKGASTVAATASTDSPKEGEAGTGSSKVSQAVGDTATTAESLLASANQVKLCTNFSEFKKFFGDFSNNPGQHILAHAVFGFFRNGGTSCYVVWVNQESEIDKALEQFEAIDDIAIVAAPGITSRTALASITAHCKALGDRVAIFDTPSEVEVNGSLDLSLLKTDNPQKVIPDNSNYAALYFPWIQVFDPVSRKPIYVPPSGHMAGVYARVDSERGVFKAPANETILGAVGLKYDISRSKQDKLNPQGVNCIRSLSGNIRVWGARTLGGDANTEFKYINIRRLFNYLRESIDEGTQWAVFEPNAPDLWAKIRRNINAFLLIAWQEGALFGNTPEQAFFVKCDEETNPPEIRNAGQVVTEIGVAIVQPAEFVVFKLSQSSGEPGS